MSWPMQPGSWNAGVPMNPNMNMGYTPDQWTLIQQQNWQQWAQWQQQYAQWQLQYGDKYAEQMQTVPAVGAGPPLPPVNCVPPPAPPPPDQPPPPHINDRPLYTPKPPPPSHAPSKPDNNVNNMKPMDGNTQAWSNTADNRNAIQNSEALKKLLEEERLFDIQFHKWEEEIEKWKLENVNHPDKQAYSEYEQKFEACRAQLLERRQQMKQKRACLTGIAPPALSNTSSVNNIQLVPPPPLPNQNAGNNVPPSVVQTQKSNSNPDTNYASQSQFDQNQYQHYEGVQDAYNNENSYVQAEATHTNKSYENVDSYYASMEQSKFLPTNETSKGIPGLDLIPEDKLSNKPQDVVDITGETMSDIKGLHSQTPDYTTISKGINNILGDEKIMNILSMVCQKPGDPVRNQSQSNIETVNSYQYNNNSDFGTRQNISYNQGSNDLYNKGNGQFAQTPYNQVQKEPMDQYYGNYTQNNVQNVPPRHQMNAIPLAQPLQTQPIQGNIEHYHRVPHETRNIPDRPILPTPTPVPRSKWVDQPLFTPSIIVEYEHKPLRLKARDFIEPVHIFEYNHKSKHSDNKKKDFEREADELFVRHPRSSNVDSFPPERMNRELYHRDYERRPRDIREPYRPRPLMRDAYDDKRRGDGRLDDWRRDESVKFTRREDFYRDREKGRDEFKDRYRVYRRDDNRNRSRSKEKENRKRDHTDDDDSFPAKKGKETAENKEIVKTKHVVMIDDILEPPGREMRPNKIAIFLRGLPGSGKSYLAKLIRDKEAEHGGTARIMSIDDYFMQEGEVEVNDPVTGKTIKKPSLKYEYEENLEESYMNSLRRAFKRSITDGYFTFIIFDAVNESVNSYSEVWNYARQQGFQAYVCTMEGDIATCHKRNIHNRTLKDIEMIKAKFADTPEYHIELDATTLLQSAAITDVHMEDADDALNMEDAGEQTEVEKHFTSKWEKMDDAVKLARLDGTSRPLRPSQLSMEDYLQIDDWKPNIAKPGKKTVRWADIEERRQQEKMRAIGFVVGQTDWNRMTDPTMGSSALTQTKYIERVRRT